MISLTDYIRYFQQIANEHVQIRDFYIMDINEVVQAFDKDMKFPALILNSMSGKFLVPNQDNTLESFLGGFAIIGNIPNLDDFHAEMDLLSDMKVIGEQIIARILHDKQKCESRSVKAFSGFDPNSVNFEMLGPVFINCFGFNFTFRLISALDLSYDPILWDAEKIISGKSLY